MSWQADYTQNSQLVRAYQYMYDLMGNRTSASAFDGQSTHVTTFTYNLASQQDGTPLLAS